MTPILSTQLYIGPWHLVRHVATEPAYQLINGFEALLTLKPDHVVLHINDLLWQGHGNDTPAGNVVRYPIDIGALKQEYEQVVVIQRTFDLEMASVWQRNKPGCMITRCSVSLFQKR